MIRSSSSHRVVRLASILSCCTTPCCYNSLVSLEKKKPNKQTKECFQIKWYEIVFVLHTDVELEQTYICYPASSQTLWQLGAWMRRCDHPQRQSDPWFKVYKSTENCSTITEFFFRYWFLFSQTDRRLVPTNNKKKRYKAGSLWWEILSRLFFINISICV